MIGNWLVYEPSSESPSPTKKDWDTLSRMWKGCVRSAMRSVARGEAPPPALCPPRNAIQCFMVPSDNTKIIYVLWTLLESDRPLLLHITFGEEACPGPAPYELARSRLNDAAI
jgi:hypothetical protein